jgi:hypothetical protein
MKQISEDLIKRVQYCLRTSVPTKHTVEAVAELINALEDLKPVKKPKEK